MLQASCPFYQEFKGTFVACSLCLKIVLGIVHAKIKNVGFLISEAYSSKKKVNFAKRKTEEIEKKKLTLK